MHFDITEWADYVRGLDSAGKRESMSRHLASGCRKCRRTAAILGSTAALAAAESRYEVPEFAVHCARAIFALEQLREVRIRPNVLGALVFDSFREPLPAGLRSHHRFSRQTLFEAGDYAIDVRQEHERGSSRVTMVGQIASRKEPGRALSGVQVVLASGDAVLAQCTSNHYGEFQMEYAPARDLRLEVGPGPDHSTAADATRRSEEGGSE